VARLLPRYRQQSSNSYTDVDGSIIYPLDHVFGVVESDAQTDVPDD
jgi:hypothetical protein